MADSSSGGPCWVCIIGGTTLIALLVGAVVAVFTYLKRR